MTDEGSSALDEGFKGSCVDITANVQDSNLNAGLFYKNVVQMCDEHFGEREKYILLYNCRSNSYYY